MIMSRRLYLIRCVLACSGRLPFPVSDQAAEHGLAPNDVPGRSYSSAYYYYEYSPRGDQRNGGEDGGPGTFRRPSYDVGLVSEGFRQIRLLNASYVVSAEFARWD